MTSMMWMGRFSGIAAFAIGALLAGFAVLQLSWGAPSWQLLLAAGLLMTGAVRTLTGRSGGLRLLCGAWGFTAGLTLAPPGRALEPGSAGHLTVDAVVGVMAIAVPIFALTGLALTVLHKEKPPAI